MKKSIKKYIKAMISKGLMEELAAFDNRIHKLETSQEQKFDIKVFELTPGEPIEDVKKEHPEKSEQLETGKWYKNAAGNLLFCFTGGYDLHKDPIGYGFLDGSWRDANSIGWTDVNIPATIKDIEWALIAEATRRGFIEGVEIKDLHTKTKGIINRVYYCDDSADLRTEKRWGLCIYHNGKWAEIVSAPKKEIDWSVPGQLVINEDESVLLMTVGKHSKEEESFQAITITYKSSVTTIGEYWKKWSKNHFSLFTGQLTLKN